MSQMLDPVTQDHVRKAADEFAGVFSEETIERYIAERSTCSAKAGSTSSFPSSFIGSHVRD